MNSLKRLYISLHANKVSLFALEKTPAFIANEKSMLAVLNELKNIKHGKNITMLLDAEKAFLEIDMTKDNPKERISSLNNGLKRISEAKNSLEAVRNFDMYSGCIKTTSSKMLDKEGLPKDSFRQAISGQVTSLMNDAKSENSKTRIAVLRERMANLAEAGKLYKDIQREQVARFDEQQREHKKAISSPVKDRNTGPER